jgi:hypothetical protein
MMTMIARERIKIIKHARPADWVAFTAEAAAACATAAVFHYFAIIQVLKLIDSWGIVVVSDAIWQ